MGTRRSTRRTLLKALTTTYNMLQHNNIVPILLSFDLPTVKTDRASILFIKTKSTIQKIKLLPHVRLQTVSTNWTSILSQRR
nr:hypothetical protein Iba_chr12dCG6660 [Ipomoea batatas]